MKPENGSSKHQPVFAVTVTYGQRREMLQQMLAGTLAEGISDFVVVDNGAHWDVTELAAQFPAATIRVVAMGGNQGSAAGFAAGMSRALEAGAEMIWLLDDDNRPQAGALATLLNAYDGLLAEGGGRHNTAVLAFRPEHQAGVAMGCRLTRQPARSSFSASCPGHSLQVLAPYALGQAARASHSTCRASGSISRPIVASSCIGSHRTIGLPRIDFVLYADDSEWSYRITDAEGQIMLITAARIEELESSWSIGD